MSTDAAARICRSVLHAASSRAAAPSRAAAAPSLRRQSRKLSQQSHNEGPSSYSPRPPHVHDRPRPTTATLAALDGADAVAHLRRTFPPLEFPPDVAQRITTHISWNRGVDGHNARLGFVGRRVLHTYLLLFLHECALAPPGSAHRKNAPVPPSARLRHSVLGAGAGGGPIDPAPLEPYGDVSERLLNTYVLGEHVGAAWQLERIMRWTPAIAELDTVRAAAPDTVLRSSGLYKVRGATVEGVVGGIFHQFGGAIAHRVFHTRVLPHIAHLGLPAALRSRAEEACERFGGPQGLVAKPSPPRERGAQSSEQRRRPRENQEGSPARDRLEDVGSESKKRVVDVEFTKVDAKETSRERQRLGYVG